MGGNLASHMGSKISGAPFGSSGSNQGPRIQIEHIWLDASDEGVQKLFKEFQFNEKMTVARALDNKATLEASRIFGEVITLGIGSIWRFLSGNCNHWAFIAKGVRGNDSIFYVAQFGEGGLRSPHKVSGKVYLTFDDAIRSVCASEMNTSTWITRPYQNNRPVYVKKVLNVGAQERTWAKMKNSLRLKALNDLICACNRGNNGTCRGYSVVNNNCQHFAIRVFKAA